MKHADYLRQMLAPLGVYRLEGTCNGGELEAVGAALDGCAAALVAAQPSTITRMFCEHALEWARDTSSVIAPATAEAPEYAELAK